MARERTSRRRVRISCAAASTEDCRRYAANAGTAHMAITPMMVTTTTISMRVVPVCRLNTRSPLGVGSGEWERRPPRLREAAWGRDGGLRRGGGLFGGRLAGARRVDFRRQRGLAVDAHVRGQALERLLAEALDLHQVRGLLEVAVLLPVVEDALRGLRTDAGKQLQLRGIRGVEVDDSGDGRCAGDRLRISRHGGAGNGGDENQ